MTAPLLTVKEVAKRLSVSQNQVYRYMADGSLNPLRLSDRVVRFTEEEIADFLRRSAAKEQP